MVTGLVWDERYMWHETGDAALFVSPGEGRGIQPDRHVENPRSKRRLRNLIDVSGLAEELRWLSPRKASPEEIHRFHNPDYVERIRAMSQEDGGDAGELTPFGPGSYEIARLAAGGCIRAVDAVVEGRTDNAYALVRPPGHHAEVDRGRGFCIFGNTVIALKHARENHGLDRMAVIDWDVHPNVLSISLHQDGYYPPETGDLEDRGTGDGEEHNLNIPLPPGSGRGAYQEAFHSVVLPALDAYEPELIAVASGFDSSGYDPLGRMLLHSNTYRWMARQLKDLAHRHSEGRIVLFHEGGYSTAYVPFCGLAVLEELSGVDTEVADPFLEFLEEMPYQGLQNHQQEVISTVKEKLDLKRVSP